jgi:1-acyl-sn-glycerol-3-phosphate acyltransferase
MCPGGRLIRASALGSVFPVISPTPEQLALLHPFERLAFRFSDGVNRSPLGKRASHWFLSRVGMTWVHHFTKHLLHIDGIEQAAELHPPGGLLLVSNHRSFFDMYVISCVLFRDTRLLQRIYFPVRSDFFYERPSGHFVNGVMSAWSMYPPVLRQPERNEFNRYAMARVSELLAQPGSVVGFHPEGTRGKGDDPYTLLPAQPGVGQLIMSARPTVLPIFINGLGNDLIRQVLGNFDGTGRKIIIVFGKPLKLEPFYTKSARLRTYMDIANYIRDTITELGDRERALRARIEPPGGGGERLVASNR